MWERISVRTLWIILGAEYLILLALGIWPPEIASLSSLQHQAARAVWATINAMGTTPLGLITTMLVPALLLLWAGYQNGWSGMKEHWARNVGNGVLVLGFVWWLVFLWHFIFLPPEVSLSPQVQVQVPSARRIPRHLTWQQKNNLIRKLRGKDGGRLITVKTTADTPLKDFDYAYEFMDVFKEAGWTIKRFWGWWYLPIEDLAIRSHPRDAVAAFLQLQLKGVGIDVQLIETEEVEENNIDLVVGLQS